MAAEPQATPGTTRAQWIDDAKRLDEIADKIQAALLDPTGKYCVGDKVRKRFGYRFPGEVRMVGTNKAGEVRYVVEALHEDFVGMLHIYSENQLELDN